MGKRFDSDVFVKHGNIVILYSVDPRVICAAQHSSYELSRSGCDVTFAGYHIGLLRFNAAYLSNVRKHLRELKLLVCRFGQPAQTPLCTHSIPVLRNGVRVHCLTSISIFMSLSLSLSAAGKIQLRQRNNRQRSASHRPPLLTEEMNLFSLLACPFFDVQLAR